VARSQGVKLGEHSLDTEVDLIKDETSFHIGARLTLTAPELDRETAEKLLHAARGLPLFQGGNIEVPPDSEKGETRGNIEVELKDRAWRGLAREHVASGALASNRARPRPITRATDRPCGQSAPDRPLQTAG
jgi:hypothetical protein